MPDITTSPSASAPLRSGDFLYGERDGDAVKKFSFEDVRSSVSGDLLTAVPAAAAADPGKGVAIESGFAYYRYAWSATLDAVQRIKLTGGAADANNPVDFFGVKTIPISTANTATALISAFMAGTVISNQGDSVAPLNYNNTYIGANHGASQVHQITAVGHGKTSADIGSEWNGPSGRKYYIIRIVSADTLWMLPSNTGTAAQWNFYAASVGVFTFTHSAGAANTASISCTADAAATQLLPALSRRSLFMLIDGAAVSPTTQAWYLPGRFQIRETYSIYSPAAMLDYLRAAPGRSYYDDVIGVDCSIVNIYELHSNGCHTIEQSITWASAVNLTYQGVVQDIPPVNTGVLRQYFDGVNPIGGIDYRATADITSSATAFLTTTATWADPLDPPNRMAQIVSVGGVNKHATVIGCSVLSGVTTRRKRLQYCNDSGGLISTATKKQYFKAVTGYKPPQAGDTYKVLGYHHVYNCELAPDATVCTWYRDGNDYVVVLDFHKTSALTRVILPTACDGWSARLLDSQAVSLLTSTVIDGGGIAVSCNAAYGFAIIRVSRV